MKSSEIVNKIHSSLIIYLLLGGFFPSQREFLVLFLPTLQFQFLINDNTCVLTQLENKLIKYEKEDVKKEDVKKEESNGFIDSKLKQYNIQVDPIKLEIAINSVIYCCFLANYFTM